MMAWLPLSGPTMPSVAGALTSVPSRPRPSGSSCGVRYGLSLSAGFPLPRPTSGTPTICPMGCTCGPGLQTFWASASSMTCSLPSLKRTMTALPMSRRHSLPTADHRIDVLHEPLSTADVPEEPRRLRVGQPAELPVAQALHVLEAQVVRHPHRRALVGVLVQHAPRHRRDHRPVPEEPRPGVAVRLHRHPPARGAHPVHEGARHDAVAADAVQDVLPRPRPER